MTMKKNTLLVAAAAALLAIAGTQGCSSDDVTTGGAGDAGEAGEAPTAGTAGTVAQAGAVGEGGAAGATVSEGGAAGEVGEGGAAGAGEPTQADLCDDFCAGEEIICTGDLQPYASAADCLTECNGYARGTVGDTMGNTLDCRIYHLNAAMANAVTHCPHTGAQPTAFCVNTK